MNWLEILGFVLSLATVWLSMQRRVASCPVGLAAVAVYALVFIDARLYSDALLQGMFALFIAYTWVHWSRHLDTGHRVEVVPLRRRRAMLHIALGIGGAIALGAFMRHGTNASLPWLDAALAAFSLVGQFWQARRHAAAWWMWIAVDVVYVGLYLAKDLWLTAFLYAIFVGLAIMGLRAWRAAEIADPDQGHEATAHGA